MSKPEDYKTTGKRATSGAGTRLTVPASLNSVSVASRLQHITREQFEAADVLGLLELASAGGYGIMFGLNRTGGGVAMLFVGGEKTRAHLEDGTGLAAWVTAATEFLEADFAQERPKAFEQYKKSTMGGNGS